MISVADTSFTAFGRPTSLKTGLVKEDGLFFFFVIEEYNYMRALTTAEGIIDRESDVKKWPEIALTRTMQSRFLSPAG